MHLPCHGGWHIRVLQVFPVKPGDFALGSQRSRAAARALLDARRAGEGEGTLFVLERIGSGSRSGRGGGKCTCPVPPAGTFALCQCFYYKGDAQSETEATPCRPWASDWPVEVLSAFCP